MKHRKLTFEELKKLSLDTDSLASVTRNPVYFVLENIRSLYNVGAVFRTADALRVEELILTGYTGRPPRKEIDKVALGSVDSVSWSGFDDTLSALNDLRKKGVQIVALEQTVDSIDFYAFEFKFPVAIVLGNEYEGIDQMTLDQCDACVEIPMLGVKQSLNVSTACGIVGYEMLRRIRNDHTGLL